MKDVLMKIKRNREEYDKRIQVLRHDSSFKPAERKERAEELWQKATEIHGNLLEQYHRKRDETGRKLADRCFRLKFSPETANTEREKAEKIFREALELTNGTPPEKLTGLLEEACAVADTPTALAIVRSAYERGVLPVLDLAARLLPERRQALLDLIEFESLWGKNLDDEIRFDPITERRPPQPPL